MRCLVCKKTEAVDNTELCRNELDVYLYTFKAKDIAELYRNNNFLKLLDAYKKMNGGNGK